MSKIPGFVSLAFAIVILLCTGGLATGWIPLQASGVAQEGTQSLPKPVAQPMREPIRVGGNVQASKLLVKVEPVYPEEAKASRVAGVVILQATINEAGEVYEVKVIRGHPLLDKAAIDAVRQWRYSPTLLNGEPVPVVATLTVAFSMSFGSNNIMVMLDESGNLRMTGNPQEGPALIEKLRKAQVAIVIIPSSRTPLPVLEVTVQNLQKAGIEKLLVPGFEVWEGRLYSQAGSIAGGAIVAVMKGPAGELASIPATDTPVLALDTGLLAGIAKSSGLVNNLPPEEKPLLYKIYINEVGEIVGIQRRRGPKIPGVEDELRRTRVISPGRRGADPVPVVFTVEVALP